MSTEEDPVERIVDASVHSLLKRSLKRTFDMYCGNYGLKVPDDEVSTKYKVQMKLKEFEKSAADIASEMTSSAALTNHAPESGPAKPSNLKMLIDSVAPKEAENTALAHRTEASQIVNINVRKGPVQPKPVWHPPWKLMRVISGHTGWVRTVAVDPSNEWFATSGNDRMIKIWDLASGVLKLSLTGHVSTVRALAISDRHPYMFSAAEDNEVKCWDLEMNQVVRNYHGHLSGVYSLALHPTLDVLVSGGRDAAVRVWDMRTKNPVHVLGGHSGTVTALGCQAAEPQIISGAADHMVRLWDLAAGKCSVTLTNHKKSIRALAIHPSQYAFVTCANDNNKIWRCPAGQFERNISGHNAIVNTCAIRDNRDGKSILVGGTDNGYLHFWDWKSGYRYQGIEGRVQPGSMTAENGIFSVAFDQSGTRLITGECDKTIKIYKEDEDATPETHPINWKPGKLIQAKY